MQASYHLSRIAMICGTGCDAYRSLAAALDTPPGSAVGLLIRNDGEGGRAYGALTS